MLDDIVVEVMFLLYDEEPYPEISSRLQIDIFAVDRYIQECIDTIEAAILSGMTPEEIAKAHNVEQFLIDYVVEQFKLPVVQGKRVRLIRDVKQAAADGLTIDRIAERINEPESRVYSCCRNESIKYRKRKRGIKTTSTDALIPKVYGLIKSGEGVREKTLAQKLGVSKSTIARLARSGRIPISTKRKALALRSALESGEKSLEKLCVCMESEEGGSVFNYAKEYRLKLPDNLIPYRTRPEIDKLIDEGLPLQEIGDRVEISRQAVWQYVVNSGQQKYFSERRDEFKQKQKIERQQLHQMHLSVMHQLREILREKSIEAGFAWEKAVENWLAVKVHGDLNFSIAEVLPIFEKYGKALNSGEKLSLQELRAGTTIQYDSTVAKILERVGLEPMYGKKDRNVTAAWKKEMIDASYHAGISISDMAFFIGVKKNVVKKRWKAIGPGRAKAQPIGIVGGVGTLYGKQTYEICEALRAGFTDGEVMELVECSNQTLIDYMRVNKDVVAQKLTEMVETIYRADDLPQEDIQRRDQLMRILG